MIEVRFDDLTGASDSFRLIGPAGVLEALRVDEVVGVIAAAESAAARGMWVAGFVAYEAAPGLDPAMRVRDGPADDPFARLPLAWFAMFEDRERTVLPEPQDGPPRPGTDPWRPSVDRDSYDAAIARIREHIAAGDTYQVNHTLRLRSMVEGDDRGLYRDLCYAQRGAYATYLNLGRYRVLSASPELFFRIDDGRITTRPMKGTARRGRWSAEDDEVAAGLRGSVKDRAENAMIVDLLRNDMGRVARTGSVTWSDVFDLERYETVWQLTSTVSADLEPTASLVDVFRALFPCGSVTGAPKVRTMEIIAELEDSPGACTAGRSGPLPARLERSRRALQRADPHGGARCRQPHRRVRGRGRHHVGVERRGRVRRDGREGAGADGQAAAVRTVRDPPARPWGGVPPPRSAPQALRESSAYFGFAYDERAVVTALQQAAARSPTGPPGSGSPSTAEARSTWAPPRSSRHLNPFAWRSTAATPWTTPTR